MMQEKITKIQPLAQNTYEDEIDLRDYIKVIISKIKCKLINDVGKGGRNLNICKQWALRNF